MSNVSYLLNSLSIAHLEDAACKHFVAATGGLYENNDLLVFDAGMEVLGSGKIYAVINIHADLRGDTVQGEQWVTMPSLQVATIWLDHLTGRVVRCHFKSPYGNQDLDSITRLHHAHEPSIIERIKRFFTRKIKK